MQIEVQYPFDVNRHMFEDVSLQGQLHTVQQPEEQNYFLDMIDNSSSDLSISKDYQDDSNCEINDETIENTIFRKFPEQIIDEKPKPKISQNKRPPFQKSAPKTVQKSKKISRGKQGAKKDYKKNICGYITRRVLKQALSDEYKKNIEDLCEQLQVPMMYFYKVYRAHNTESITGPTHFYNLANPKMNQADLQESIKEIRVRMVFLIFFKWFMRNRYVRYLMGEGKMSEKDKYVQYKNREMLFLIASDWKEILDKVMEELGKEFGGAKRQMRRFEEIYNRMIKKYGVFSGEQKEQKKSSCKKQKRNVQNPEEESQDQIKPIRMGMKKMKP